MKVKVGDYVMWRGAWGKEPARKARIKNIEITSTPKDKEGVTADSVDHGSQCYICDLDNGKWAYGWQIDPIK